jgi:hypothetical protein
LAEKEKSFHERQELKLWKRKARNVVRQMFALILMHRACYQISRFPKLFKTSGLREKIVKTRVVQIQRYIRQSSTTRQPELKDGH